MTQELPDIDKPAVGRIVDCLSDHRVAEAIALVLWLAAALYKSGTPWPSNARVAEHLGLSEEMVVAALSVGRAQNLITVEDVVFY